MSEAKEIPEVSEPVETSEESTSSDPIAAGLESSSSELAGSGSISSDFPQDAPKFWTDLVKHHSSIVKMQKDVKEQTSALAPNFKSINTQVFDGYERFVSDYSRISEDHPDILPALTKGLKAFNGLRMQLDAEFTKWGEALAQEEGKMARFLATEEELAQVKLKYVSKAKAYLTTKINTKSGKEKIGSKEGKIRNRKQEMDMHRVELASTFEEIESQKEMLALGPLLDALKAYQEFFRKGMELLEPLNPVIERFEEYTNTRKEFVAKQAEEIMTVRKEWEEAAKEDKRIDLTTQYIGGTGIRDLDAQRSGGGPKDMTRVKSGYLFVQKPQFQRVYCELDGENFSILFSKSIDSDFSKGRLETMAATKGFVKKPAASAKSPKTQADILLPCQLCTVKETANPQFSFEFSIISAANQKVTLQADNIEDMKAWVTAIQNAISHGLAGPREEGTTSATSTEEEKEKARKKAEDEKAIADQLARLRAVPGNDSCADCSNKDPVWLSMNLGIMMCLACSGVHRSLGVHISKVRSAQLDRLDPYLMATMESLGNDAALEAWEGKLLQSDKLKKSHKPNNCSKNWIRAKYEKKSFVARPSDETFDANALLFESIENNNPVELLRSLALGADVNFENPEQDNRTASHHAVMYGEKQLVDLVIQNGADLEKKESRGWTPLHYAAYQDDSDLCDLLLLRGGSRLATIESLDGANPLATSQAFYEGPKDSSPKCARVLTEALEKVAKRAASSLSQ